MSMSRILVRLPTDVRNWLKSQAEANSSTMTAEVVRSVRDRIERDARKSGGSNI
jgi:Arc-like DNA binding domain